MIYQGVSIWTVTIVLLVRKQNLICVIYVDF